MHIHYSILCTTDIEWYFKDTLLQNSDKYTIEVVGNIATLKIKKVTFEDEGFYICKLVNLIGMTLSRAKLIMTTTSGGGGDAGSDEEVVKTLVEAKSSAKKKTMKKTKRIAKKKSCVQEYISESEEEVVEQKVIVVTEYTSSSDSEGENVENKTILVQEYTSDSEEENVIKKTTIVEEYNSESESETIETSIRTSDTHATNTTNENMETRYEEEYIITTSESALTQIETTVTNKTCLETTIFSESIVEEIKYSSEVNEILEKVNLKDFGQGEKSLRDLATIGCLMRKGISTTDITNMYNKNIFPNLKQPESQSALVQLVEREGHSKIITEILSEEKNVEESIVAATVGFRAFLKMIEMRHVSIEDVITRFLREDFLTQTWKTVYITEVCLFNCFILALLT